MSDDTELPRRPFPIWKVSLAIMVLLVGATTWLFFFHDDAPPDDAHMLPKWSERGGDENPLAVFCRTFPENAWMDYHSELSATERLLLPGTEEAVEAFIESRGDWYAQIDQLLATDPDKWQWPGREAMARYNHRHDDVERIRAANLMVRLMGRQLCRDDQPADAGRLGAAWLQLASGLSRAEGSMVRHLVASTTAETALAIIEEAAMHPAMKEAQIYDLQMLVAKVPQVPSSTFAFSLRVEHLSVKNSLPELDRTGLGSLAIDGSTLDQMSGSFFKPNRTLAMETAIMGPVVHGLDKSWLDGLHAQQQASKQIEEIKKQQGSFGYYADGNPAGRLLLTLMLPMNERILERTISTQAWQQMCLTQLALRRYELEHGKLPEKLEELVPVHLDSVPSDPFTGQPIRWIKEKLTLYSVGPDLVDGQGDIDARRATRGKDPGALYWWSKEGEAKRKANAEEDATRAREQEESRAGRATAQAKKVSPSPDIEEEAPAAEP